jgi:hypothetical protein
MPTQLLGILKTGNRTSKFGEWVGKVSWDVFYKFNNILLTHGHGTHTECLGHITRDFTVSIKLSFFFMAELVSVTEKEERFVITKNC